MLDARRVIGWILKSDLRVCKWHNSRFAGPTIRNMSTPCKTDFTFTYRDVSHLLENENLLKLMIVFGCCFPYSPDSRYLSSECSTLMHLLISLAFLCRKKLVRSLTKSWRMWAQQTFFTVIVNVYKCGRLKDAVRSRRRLAHALLWLWMCTNVADSMTQLGVDAGWRMFHSLCEYV